MSFRTKLAIYYLQFELNLHLRVEESKFGPFISCLEQQTQSFTNSPFTLYICIIGLLIRFSNADGKTHFGLSEPDWISHHCFFRCLSNYSCSVFLYRSNYWYVCTVSIIPILFHYFSNKMIYLKCFFLKFYYAQAIGLMYFKSCWVMVSL